MIIKYRDDKGEVHDFPWRPAQFESEDSEALEEVGGRQWETFEEFADKFIRGSQRAYRAAVWLMLRKTNPSLRFQDVSIRPDQVAVVFDDAEQEAIRQVMMSDPELTDEDREALARNTANQYWGDGETPLGEPPVNSGENGSDSPTPDSLPASGS